jgi:replicative DNA helicase
MITDNISPDMLFQELKRIIETDKVFMGNEFVTYYTRCAFGKKPDKDVIEIASLLAKEFKTFINMIKSKEKEYNIKFLAFDDIASATVNILDKCIDSRKKYIDGDICLEDFKKILQSDSRLASIQNEILSRYCVAQDILSMDVINLIEEKFTYRKCLFNIFEQHQVLMNFIIKEYKTCKDLDEYMSVFNKIIDETVVKTKISELSRGDIINLSTSNFEDYILQELNKEHIPTRYKVFDYAFNGGFENGRVYIMGGISGGGKSLVLINLAYTAKISLDERRKLDNIPESEKWGVLYLTLENGKEETQARFVSCATGIAKHEFESSYRLNNYNYVKEKYDQVFVKPNSTEIFIVWRSPGSINTFDIMSLINDIERTYGTKIKIVFIDYADKLAATTESKTGQEWIDLGKIVDDLKAMSVEFNIPVVTVTQVNRSGYGENIKGDKIAGSIRKRENADVLVLFDFSKVEETVIDYNTLDVDDILNNTDNYKNYKEVWGIIDKNRDGPSNIRFLMRIDYTVCRMFDIPERISIIFDEDPSTVKLAKYKVSVNTQDINEEEQEVVTTDEDETEDLWKVDIDTLI